MKLFKILVMALGLSAVNAHAQDVVIEDLPVATINTSFYVTLPDIPVQEYYFVDISHMVFADEQEAIYLLTSYVTGNLITNEIHYADGYMIIHIHTEYVEGEIELAQLQDYLNHLSKPVE